MSERIGLDLDAVAARRKRAQETVSALCKGRGQEGGRDWTMSIPARPDYDPDLVIAASLRDIAGLVAELRQLRETCDHIVDLAEAWDEEGATGPKLPYRWETVARMAMDLARSARHGNPEIESGIEPGVLLVTAQPEGEGPQ